MINCRVCDPLLKEMSHEVNIIVGGMNL
jgi:hypothetical protein